MQYLDSGLYPVEAPTEVFLNWRGKLGPSLWLKITAQSNNTSLRQLAKEYGVSYETIRRILDIGGTRQSDGGD
jgi:Zn-dependent peptidase ImmA (M78 family)